MHRCLDRTIQTRLRDIGEARIAINAYLANPHPAEDAAKPAAAAKPVAWAAAGVLALALARLGGYLPRNKKGQPGWQVLWRGWMRLQDMVEYALAAGLEK